MQDLSVFSIEFQLPPQVKSERFVLSGSSGHNAASHPIWAKCTLKTIKARIGAFLGLSVFRPFSVDLFRGEWR